MRKDHRHTKIIATLGPATADEEILGNLIKEGVDVVRLNMAHASPEWTRAAVTNIRKISDKIDRQVAIMMDIKGPEIRTGDVDVDWVLEKGEVVEFYTKEAPEGGVDRPADMRAVSVNYRGLPEEVQIGNRVLVDSGLIRMEVVEKGDSWIRCEVHTPAKMGSRRHINLPGVYVDLPALTEKDADDIAVGVEMGIDFFALSFVRQSSDVEELRAVLDKLRSQAGIIAKIEDQTGMENLSSIVKAADSIMVARGDLGIEIDYHLLPLVQRKAVEVCHSMGKPVIIATHLLESMITAPMPTRAEISDVAMAVREQADAVMLSGETTVGCYPMECVEVLKNIIRTMEPSVVKPMNETIALKTPKAKMLRSAAVLAQDLNGAGVVVFTRSGFLPHVLAALRAYGVPIYAFTDVPEIFRRCLLPWGVEPFLMEFSEDPEETIQRSFELLKNGEWCKNDDSLVVITNALARERVIDTIQFRTLE